MPRQGSRRTPAGSAEAAVLALARTRPEIGQFRAAAQLRERGVAISPSGVRAIWKRHGLTTTLQRLSACGGAGRAMATLSDAQQRRLDRARTNHRLLADQDGAGDKGAWRREQVLAAAAREFSAKGYESSSLRDIAAAAGVLAGSLYYHFKSKDELFATVHAEGFRQLHVALDVSLAGLTDPWARLEAACAAHLNQVVNGNDIAVVTAGSLFRTMRPALQRRLNRQRDDYEQRFRELIDDLKLPRRVDRSMLRLLLLGGLNWARLWYRPGKASPAEIARRWVRDILAR